MLFLLLLWFSFSFSHTLYVFVYVLNEFLSSLIFLFHIVFFSFFYVFMNLNVWSWFKIAVRSIKDFEVSIIVLESQFQLRWYKVPECSCNCDHNLKPWIWSLTSDNNGISEEKFFVLFCVVWLERESMEEAMLSNQTRWNIFSCFYLFLIFFFFFVCCDEL
jgi:hypothetical protein